MKTPKFVNKFMNGKITENKLVWFLISISIIAIAGIAALIYWLCGVSAMNLGIDFTGGTIIEVYFGSELDKGAEYTEWKDAVVKIVEEEGLGHSAPQKTGSDDAVAISIRCSNQIAGKDASDEALKTARENVQEKIRAQLTEKFPSWSKERVDSAIAFNSVTATASTTVWLNALFCVLIAAALILVYIAIRFKLSAGVAAIIALLHDVAIMVSFVTIIHWQINAPFIAAMITIIGYSINNTIVIFDRVRENSKKQTLASLTPYELADLSVKQTMTRSINTSVTTLLTIVMLFIFGVTAIREFTLPIIIGLLAGTYSSIFVAPSLWAMFRTNKLNRDKRNNAVYPGGKSLPKVESKNA